MSKMFVCITKMFENEALFSLSDFTSLGYKQLFAFEITRKIQHATNSSHYFKGACYRQYWIGDTLCKIITSIFVDPRAFQQVALNITGNFLQTRVLDINVILNFDEPVIWTNTIMNEMTVMIHFFDTSIANPTMLGSDWSKQSTRVTQLR